MFLEKMVNRMTEVYKCRRCLKRPNMTYRPDPNEVLKVCAECGTENWCLPVGKEKGATKAKKVVEAAETEVAESTPSEVKRIEGTDALIESAEEIKAELEAESVTEVPLDDGQVSSEEQESPTSNETMTEKERLLARLAKLDAEETE